MTDEEVRLKRQVEQITGGQVVSLERQPRWRKAWYISLELNGEILPIYIRGDKQVDAEVYPGLERERRILELFAANKLPVPRVFGMTADPEGIIMERVTGSRVVAEARDDEERRKIAEQYIDVLAKMHNLDIQPFVEAGITLPNGPKQIALAYLDANIPLYRRTKRTPQPLVEFVLKWVQRNAPVDRNVARFIHADPGQFLFKDGNLTCIYDFEASHIGDPLADLAALRVRHGTEPLGASPNHLIRYYAQVSGAEIDLRLLSFHTVAFVLTTVMALAGPLADPKPQDMQLEYLIWDLMMRRALLWAMGEYLGVKIVPSSPVELPTGRFDVASAVLNATLGRIETKTPMAENDKAAAAGLIPWMYGSYTANELHGGNDLRRAAAILGHHPANWQDADEKLEAFVLNAGPEHDMALFEYFAAQTEERVAEAIPFQSRLAEYALAPITM